MSKVPVKVIQQRKAATLVEYGPRSNRRRVAVPRGAIEDDMVDESVLNHGIQHGAPWAEMVTLQATPEAVEQALHDAGIWTVEELRAAPDAARAALQKVYGVDLAALLRAANEYHREGL